MASVSSPPRPVGAAPPTVRHGTCRLTVRIRGTDYRLRPMPAPAGFKAVWTLRKLDPHATATYTVAAPKGAQPGCTCPDHEIDKSVCKHIMALAALGLIAKPKAARPVKARTRQIHAKNARQAIAEAKALPVEAPPPGGDGHSRRLAARRRPPVVCRRLPPGSRHPRRPVERHGRPLRGKDEG